MVWVNSNQVCGISHHSRCLLYVDCCQISLDEKNKGESIKRMKKTMGEDFMLKLVF